MMSIEPKEEPETFNEKVRKPGQVFLKTNARPKNWKNREYWQNSIADLYDAYEGICSYCAEWIPETTGDPTVDHFIPKSIRPDLAYEWDNFRLACLRFNRWKHSFQDVLDPFLIGSEWFMIQFPSLQLKPNPNLTTHQKSQIDATIKRLRLNGPICIRSRNRWIKYYNQGKFDFDYLKRHAPLIAHELERQNLVNKIKDMMKP
jgi:uncharacterized protein (TIGR02646 family)